MVKQAMETWQPASAPTPVMPMEMGIQVTVPRWWTMSGALACADP